MSKNMFHYITVSNNETTVTATSLSGVCNGPTHCCCAIWPVTERSTLFVKYLLLATDGSFNTLFNASITVNSGNTMGIFVFGCHVCSKTLRGTLPNIISRSKFTGCLPFSEIKLLSSVKIT